MVKFLIFLTPITTYDDVLFAGMCPKMRPVPRWRSKQ